MEVTLFRRALAKACPVILIGSALSGIGGCGDDPSRDAGTIELSKAKAQAAANGQAGPDAAVGKKGQPQSKGSGRVRPDM